MNRFFWILYGRHVLVARFRACVMNFAVLLSKKRREWDTVFVEEWSYLLKELCLSDGGYLVGVMEFSRSGMSSASTTQTQTHSQPKDPVGGPIDPHSPHTQPEIP